MPEMMSDKQAAVLEKVIKTWIKASAVERDTGQASALAAAEDQIKAYEREFNTICKIIF